MTLDSSLEALALQILERQRNARGVSARASKNLFDLREREREQEQRYQEAYARFGDVREKMEEYRAYETARHIWMKDFRNKEAMRTYEIALKLYHYVCQQCPEWQDYWKILKKKGENQ